MSSWEVDKKRNMEQTRPDERKSKKRTGVTSSRHVRNQEREIMVARELEMLEERIQHSNSTEKGQTRRHTGNSEWISSATRRFPYAYPLGQYFKNIHKRNNTELNDTIIVIEYDTAIIRIVKRPHGFGRKLCAQLTEETHGENSQLWCQSEKIAPKNPDEKDLRD